MKIYDRHGTIQLVKLSTTVYCCVDDRESSIKILEQYVSENDCSDETLIIVNGYEAEMHLPPRQDRFMASLNNIASNFKNCYFSNSNALGEQSLAIISDQDDYREIQNFIHYPYAFFNQITRKLGNTHCGFEFNKHFIFQNGVPKLYRARLYNDIHSYKINHKCNISWLVKQNGIEMVEQLYNLIPDAVVDFGNPQYLDIDSLDILWREQNTISDFYHESAIDLFVESVYDNNCCIFYTEKTTKPLVTGKVFLGFGPQHFYRYLESMGFQLYDEIIDYSFDTIEDASDRYTQFFNNVVEISKLDINYLTDKIVSVKDKIEHNKKLARTYRQPPQQLLPLLENNILLEKSPNHIN